jgi:hypothetical protein
MSEELNGMWWLKCFNFRPLTVSTSVIIPRILSNRLEICGTNWHTSCEEMSSLKDYIMQVRLSLDAVFIIDIR